MSTTEQVSDERIFPDSSTCGFSPSNRTVSAEGPFFARSCTDSPRMIRIRLLGAALGVPANNFAVVVEAAMKREPGKPSGASAPLADEL